MFSDPARYTLSNLESNVADLTNMRQLRSAKHDFVSRWLQQINETGVTVRDANHKRDELIEHFLQRHCRAHNSTDAMQQRQLRGGFRLQTNFHRDFPSPNFVVDAR